MESQVKVRSEARGIGNRAIKRAGAERAAEEAAMAQRAALAAMLSGKFPDLNTAVESLIAQQVYTSSQTPLRDSLCGDQGRMAGRVAGDA